MRKRGRYLRTVLAALLVLTAISVFSGCNEVLFQEPVAGTVCRFDFTSTADGVNLPCSVYLPNGYDPAKSYPVWLELHSVYAYPIVNNDPNNPFSNQIKQLADARGWIVLAPWGRNLHSMYMDGVSKDSGPNAEPDIYDNMSSLAGWTASGGHWTTQSGGCVRQSDQTAIWKELVRSGSSGADYSIRVRGREIGRSGALSAFGVNFRHTATGEFYHVDLATDTSSGVAHKYVRMYRYAQGRWNLMYQIENDWNPITSGETWIDLKVNDYAGYIEVYVNDQIINMQPNYDSTPYGYGRFAYDLPVAGEVSLASYGGAHEFDDFRVQNEYEYGERDILDCLGQAAEKYNLDESRIYLAGHSMGGLGAYTLGLHNPGTFAAASASDALSDLIYDYRFLRDYFPRNPGSPYAGVNDGQLTDYLRTINGEEHNPSASLDNALMKDNSARYVLENAANLPYHIVHGGMDGTIPNNTTTPVNVSWWAPWFFLWGQYTAPSPYSPYTSTYANGKDIYDLLVAWAGTGAYSGDYVTDPEAGHGFMEPYTDTAAYFADKALVRHPTQVAYKTYDDTESTSYWMKMKRYAGAGNEAGMSRVSCNQAANSVSAHARNVEQLSLDLKRMGMDAGAGKTITINLDTNISPVNMPVNDVLGRTSLMLTHSWPNPSGIKVRLDGVLLAAGTGYTWQDQTLTVPGITLGSARVLTMESPASVAANLLANPGFETAGADGNPASWSSSLESGGTAIFERNLMQPHSGSAAARVKNPAPGASPWVSSWNQTVSGITAGRQYALSTFFKTRMLKGALLRMEIAWLNSSGGTISTSISQAVSDAGYSNRDWAQLYLKAQAPTGAVSARVKLETVGSSAGAASGSAFFDDASLFALP